MSKSEIEPEPIVGDDGELLDADPTVDMRSYNAYVNFLRRIAAREVNTSANLLFMIIPGLALIGLVLFVMGNLAQQRDNLKATPTAANLPLTAPVAVVPVQTFSRYFEHSVEAVQWVAVTSGHDLMVSAVNKTGFIWDIDQNKLRNYLLDQELSRVVFDWSPDRTASICQGDGITNIIFKCDAQNKIISTIVPAQSLTRVPRLIRWSPDETKLAIVYQPNNLEIITLDNQLLESSQVPETLADFRWTHDSQQLIGIDQGQFWHFQNGQSWTTSPFPNRKIYQFKQSPDGTKFAITIEDGSRWSLLVLEDGKTSWEVPMLDVPYQSNIFIAWSPDGEHLSTFADNAAIQQIIVWNPADGTSAKRIDIAGKIASMDWSLDSLYLAVGSDSGVTIWSPS